MATAVQQAPVQAALLPLVLQECCSDGLLLKQHSALLLSASSLVRMAEAVVPSAAASCAHP